ncbi:MAG: CheR family methyltransferase [bacterium]
MNVCLSDNLLSQLSELVAEKMALNFPEEKWGDLSRRAGAAAKEFGFSDIESFVQWLVASRLTTEQIELLASHLTVHETYFWREPQVFEALLGSILPELIRARQKTGRLLRIWSAGCSTGEEPYSIAIALRRAIPDIKDWHITILATDINPRMVRRALAGVYGEWSFRNAPPWLKDGYFRRRKEKEYELLPEIRKMVKFGYLNLGGDIYPSPMNNTNAMDIIFCRNVLMYFKPERARQIGRSFYGALVDEGWLIVSSSELSQHLFPDLTSVNFPGAIVYRKCEREYRPSEIFSFEIPYYQNDDFQQLPKAAGPVEAEPLFQFPIIEKAQDIEMPALQRTMLEETAGSAPPARSEETAEMPKGDKPPHADAQTVRELANCGKLAEALAACEEAIAAEKLDPGLYYLHATILQEQNLEDKAMVSFKRALYLDPDFVLAHFAIGNILMRGGNARSAGRYFRNALDLLNKYGNEDALPESGGLTADRFREIINATMLVGATA